MTDDFFVDADGLTNSSTGFAQKAAELQALAQQVHGLANPGRVLAAAGNDKNGQNFANVHLEAANKIFTGLDAWAKAVDGTTTAVRDMADSFRDVDEGATELATSLRQDFTQLNSDVTGGGGGGPTAPLEAREGTALRPTIPSKPAK
ncbi:hypothetical protein VSH64_34825 [Amycolatopsis rhabdoformis]|uniref:WXG100 family type VII secretion target n=1 Tax=Amycolatopsis rhabdoformis TaxID=1448059 RepID=A0ABZ1I0P9_9PSEU|nr:hypothetical protein [Amycolatopsis rhabdoformis]WSE27990.1 hypothetical protein VSH64_34825 [Amycolatopsis rhabdoformis]